MEGSLKPTTPVLVVSECVRKLACMQKLEGSGGMLPQEIFWML